MRRLRQARGFSAFKNWLLFGLGTGSWLSHQLHGSDIRCVGDYSSNEDKNESPALSVFARIRYSTGPSNGGPRKGFGVETGTPRSCHNSRQGNANCEERDGQKGGSWFKTCNGRYGVTFESQG